MTLCFERIASGCSKCSPVGSFSDGCTNGGLREGMFSLQQVPGRENSYDETIWNPSAVSVKVILVYLNFLPKAWKFRSFGWQFWVTFCENKFFGIDE